MADEGQQQITALLRIVAERPNFPLVEEEVPISEHIIEIGKNRNAHRVRNHE
jgi:hypothetical protein